LNFSFFVGDVISGVGFGMFGWGYQAMGPNRKSQFSDSSFYWKLGHNWVVQAFDWLSNISFKCYSKKNWIKKPQKFF